MPQSEQSEQPKSLETDKINDAFNDLEKVLRHVPKNFFKDHVLNVIDKAKKARNLDPLKYLNESKGKVSLYYKNIADLVDNEWETSCKKLEDYRQYIQKLHCLTQFQEIINQPIEIELLAKISKIEEELQKYIASNPNELKQSLEKLRQEYKESEEYERKHYYQAEKMLELLSIANPKVKRIKRNNENDRFVIDFENKRWEFTVFITSEKSDEFIAVTSEKNSGLTIVKPLKEVLNALENNTFGEIIAEAEESYDTEQKHSSTLEQFDLPKDDKISYIRLFCNQDKSDNSIAPMLHNSAMFSSGLKSRYPNLDIQPLSLVDNPKSYLKNKIKEAYSKGVRHFFVDIYAHAAIVIDVNGSEMMLGFSQPINAKDLANITKEFPDAKFYFSTLSCNGGGLRKGFLDAFEENPELKDSITVFLQTKPDITNTARTDPKSTLTWSLRGSITLPLYQIVLLQSLLEGKTFGQAVIEADKQSKKLMKLDPETIINGQLITENTNKPLSSV